MKKWIVAGMVALSSMSVQANTAEFGRCLVDALNGKERKTLARWIYFAMAAHPEIEQFSNISQSDKNATDRFVGGLITRLLTENCATEFKVAQKSDPQAVEKAFELVGQVAMQELMNNDSVMTAITSYAQYADMEKIGSMMRD